ncbi:SDR family oxidoreductase [soil metagenome]
MADRTVHLVTGVAGGFSSVSRLVADLLLDGGENVRAMVHRDDGRADALRERGAEIVVGDLKDPGAVAAALSGATRVFFNMAVSADYLEAAAVVAAIAKEHGDLEVLVNMSQMTVSEMTSTSTEESNHQRWHWLAEQILNWSGVPTVHVRPTVFLDNPLFTLLSRQSISERGELVLPFGDGRTSPVAATDVARTVAAILRDPACHIGHVYELTGPEILDVKGLAEQYAKALHRPVTGVDMSLDGFVEAIKSLGISPHITDHITTVAKLHRANRYDRLTSDVETVTGTPAESVEHYISAHRDLFG